MRVERQDGYRGLFDETCVALSRISSLSVAALASWRKTSSNCAPSYKLTSKRLLWPQSSVSPPSSLSLLTRLALLIVCNWATSKPNSTIDASAPRQNNYSQRGLVVQRAAFNLRASADEAIFSTFDQIVSKLTRYDKTAPARSIFP